VNRNNFNVTENLGLFRVAGGSGQATPGETVRVWVVEVEGTVVTIWFGSTRPTFDAMVEDADAIVGSIVWGGDSQPDPDNLQAATVRTRRGTGCDPDSDPGFTCRREHEALVNPYPSTCSRQRRPI
jgi:hypothetical protein